MALLDVSSEARPTYHDGLIDACTPSEMKLKKAFPTVMNVSPETRAKLRAKFPHIFPPM